MATPLLDLMRRIAEANVDGILVGGMAATLHGSTLVTHDLDICVRFDLVTCERILAAVGGRMRPDRLPLRTDPTYYVGSRNLYVRTTLGVVDFLGEVAGVGGFDEVFAESLVIDLGDFSVRVMSLDKLIVSKRTMGRDKDHRALVELDAIRARRSQS
jgi:hypothetical protein